MNWHCRNGKKLDGSIRAPLKKKLAERLENPRVLASALACRIDYKIKLASKGYRLIYCVDDEVVFVTVIAVGKREKSKAYDAARSRL